MIKTRVQYKTCVQYNKTCVKHDKTRVKYDKTCTV